MGEFGHHAARIPGAFIDAWGSGPFVIEVDGKRHRFEDSDRFGPLRIDANDMPSNRQWGERSPFWQAHRYWWQQGRRVADDGITCVWLPGRPTLLKMLNGRNALVVSEGDEGAATLDIDTPEGRAVAAERGLLDLEPRP